MLISKFDLYKPEWLELVFADRNKAYGAYELRRHNAKNISMAMLFTLTGVFLAFGAGQLAHSLHKPGPVYVVHEIKLTNFKEQQPKVVPPPPKIDPPKPVATQRFLPPVVRQDNTVTEQPPKIEDLTEAISTVTQKGTHDPAIPEIDEAASGTAAAVTEDNEVHNLAEVQVMPTPVGGEDAWTKFLTKNLRFPPEAQDAGVGGKVYMSFVVEKDGSLTDITVVRGAGYGMDEEATRVLKLAKPWKPGIQNGRPVRVKFVIPINFQMGSE